jgi:hypothetical protein
VERDELEQHFQAILAGVSAISDPLEQMKACGDVYELAMDLIVATGSNGIRRQAAKRAVRRYGVVAVADATNSSVATIKRVTGQ